MPRTLVASLACAALLTLSAGLAASDSALAEFSLKDQFDNKHTHEDVAGAVVLLIGADGEGAQYNAAWSTEIKDALADHPNFGDLAELPYADLRGVPFFARGYVRGMMPEEPAAWVLMDWKGRLAKRFEFVRGEANVLVFAPDGQLAIQAAGTEPPADVVAELVRVLRQLLDEV